MTRDITSLLAAAADLYANDGNRAAGEAAERLRSQSAAGSNVALGPARLLPDLAAAVSAMPPGPLRHALEDVGPFLSWSGGDYERPGGLADRYAFVEVVGPDGVLPAEALRFGFYLQAPETHYPSHSHAAEEFYLPVSGTALWQKDSGPFDAVAPGRIIHHVPFQRHAMQTRDEPMLAMWIWTGDLGFASYTFHLG